MGSRARLIAIRAAQAGLCACLVCAAPAPIRAAPASAPQDTTPAPPDTLAADTVPAALRDTAAQDTLPTDTVPPDTTPIVPLLPYPDAWVVARWDRAELLLNGALTLGDLLAGVDELHAVRFGFLEGPSALTCCGTGPVAVEYTVDGSRVLPQGTGAFEPILIPLADVESVTLRRTAGGYRVDVVTLRLHGPPPRSAIEGGTGDYDITLLRGLFLSRFRGGEVGFGLDRVETRGFQTLGAAERIAVSVSYAARLPLGFGAQARWRSSHVSRASLEAPERSEFVAHLRRRLGDAFALDLTAARARTRIDSVAGSTRPGREVRTTAYALQLAGERPWVEGALRVEGWSGDSVPDFAASLELAVRPVPWLRVGGDGRTTWEDGENYDEGAARVRLIPHERVSLGLDLEAGYRRLHEIPAQAVAQYRRATLHARAEVAGLEVRGSVGRWRVTPSLPFGFFYDRDASPAAGGTATAWRVAGSAPTPIRDIRLVGLYEWRGDGDFLYWPLDRAEAGASIRGTYKDGQLEVAGTFRLVVRGPMRSLSVETDPPSPVILPRRIGSAGEIAVRVKDVRVFLTFEGFADPEESPDVGGAQLPQTRTAFGLRWEFWN